MRTINKEIFGITLGFFFSIPTTADIFLQYIVPTIQETTNNSAIPFGIAIITILVFISSLVGLFDVIKKYYKMRGVLTEAHIRNMLIAGFLGALAGMFLRAIIF